MSVAKIAITIEAGTLQRLDYLVKSNRFPNRSRAIQEAIEEKITKIEKSRLASQCSLLDREEEQAMADEGMDNEVNEWPQY